MADDEPLILYYVDKEDSESVSMLQDSASDTVEGVESSQKDQETESLDTGELFQCQFCPSQFDRELGLYGHLNTHKNQVFSCTYKDCHQELGSLKSFRRHMKEHTGTSHPFKCDECGLRFDRKSQLGYHIERNHQKVVKISCPICKKGFYKSSDLQYHLNSHTEDKKYSCETCGKGFSHISNLNRHKRIHTEEKPYVCQECGKRFNQSSTLNYHTKIHTTNVFGQCPECPKKFKTGRVLLKHLRSVHNYNQENLTKVASNSILFSYKKFVNLMAGTKVKQEGNSKCFYCEVCGEQFAFKFQQKSHMVGVHGNQNSFPCLSCHQTFSSCDQLLGHPCKISNSVTLDQEGLQNTGKLPLDITISSNENEGRILNQNDESAEYEIPRTNFLVGNNDEVEELNQEDKLLCGDSEVLNTRNEHDSSNPPYQTYVQSENYFEENSQTEETAANNSVVSHIIRSYVNPSDQVVILREGEAAEVENDDCVWGPESPVIEEEDCTQELSTTTIELIMDDSGVISAFGDSDLVKVDGQHLRFDGPGLLHSEYVIQPAIPQTSLEESNKEEVDIGFVGNVEVDPPQLNEDCPASIPTVAKPFNCQDCGKSFVKKSNLKNHQGLHRASERKFKCSECNETFAWKSSLNRHVSKHHTIQQDPNPEFQCNYCDKKYKVLSILNDHFKRDHMNERKHQCDICQKAFFKINDLKYHKRLHLSIKPYVCSTCGKKFSHLSHFYRHERIHTGEKPFTCNICGKSFNQTNALKSHQKTHINDCSVKQTLDGYVAVPAEV